MSHPRNQNRLRNRNQSRRRNRNRRNQSSEHHLQIRCHRDLLRVRLLDRRRGRRRDHLRDRRYLLQNHCLQSHRLELHSWSWGPGAGCRSSRPQVWHGPGLQATEPVEKKKKKMLETLFSEFQLTETSHFTSHLWMFPKVLRRSKSNLIRFKCCYPGKCTY